MIAAIYARRSALDDKLGRSVSEQEQAGRADCALMDWTVADVYVDDGRSASRFATRAREDWKRFLTDLEADAFNVLWLWESDRGSRELEDWAGMLNRCRRQGVLIHVSTHHRTYDPRVGRDWRALAEDGVDSAYASEKLSVNVKRAMTAKAQRGESHGFTAYGWKRVRTYDDRGRQIECQELLDPEQADLIREGAVRLLAGESLRSIVSDFNRRQLSTPRTGSWNTTVLRQILKRERNAGLQVHNKQVIGRGNWEPIYGEDIHLRIREMLSDPSRRTSPINAAKKHLLSGVLICDLCENTLCVNHGAKRPPAYVCPHCFRVRRRQSHVDQAVTQLVLRRLAQPDAQKALTPDADPGLFDEAAALRARLNLVADQYADDVIDAQQLSRITSKLRDRLDDVERRLRQFAGPNLADLARRDIADVWETVPLDRKRAVINLLAEIRVLPIGRTGRAAFDPEGIDVRWREGS